MASGITAVVPAHPPRIRDGMLARSLDSVAAQTLRPDEVSLAVDTGPLLLFSPEDWRDALAELESYPFTTDKRGAWHTRQRALDKVETEWVAFLDSDDEWFPEHLAVHTVWAAAERADYVYAWYQLRGTRPVHEVFPPEYFTEPWWPDKPRHTTMTVMVKTELAKQVGFLEPEPGWQVGNEDWRFTLGCVEAGAKIVHIPSTRTWTWWWHQENSSGLPSNW